MPDPLSRRDYPRESHDPSPTKPNQAQLTTSLGHPIHPTTSTSTHERDTMDGSKLATVEAIRQLIFDEAPTWEENFPTGPGLVVSLTDAAIVIARHNTTETTDQSRPVVGLVARVVDLDAIEAREDEHYAVRVDVPALVAEVRRLRGRLVVEYDDERDSVAGIRELVDNAWPSASALDWRYAHTLLLEVDRLAAERTADATTIGVLSAAVAKVAALHVDDGDGWCKACQTLGYPCPTVLALGAGR